VSCLPNCSSGSAGDPPLFGLQPLAETLFIQALITAVNMGTINAVRDGAAELW